MDLEPDVMELQEIVIEEACEEACERIAIEAEHATVLNTTRINVQEENVSFRGDLEGVVEHISNCLCERPLAPHGTSVSNGCYLPQKHCCFAGCQWIWNGDEVCDDVVNTGNNALARHLGSSHGLAFDGAFTALDRNIPRDNQIVPSTFEIYCEVNCFDVIFCFLTNSCS